MKQEIYTAKIEPLILEIASICHSYGIAMLANFEIPTAEDELLVAVTHLPDENGDVSETHLAAVQGLRGFLTPITQEQFTFGFGY